VRATVGRGRWVTAALLGAVLVGPAAPAAARPTYFNTLTGTYGIGPGDNLDACGVCHFRWTGTGPRNLYGSAVEQELYLGKSISQALRDVEGADSDGDGFTNLQEIVTFMTLPGYSCDNFHEAIGAPPDYHSYITPMVSSCLEPLDIRVSPTQVSFLTEIGATDSVAITIFNNGSVFALAVGTLELLAGAHPALSLVAPAAPFVVPVGQSVVAEIVFAPATPAFATGTVRIASDDPDEGVIDVAVSGFGFVESLAPAEVRASCRQQIDTVFRRYATTHLREWHRCYLDEVAGIRCDTGRRDLKLAKAEERLRDAVGGKRDRRCAGAGLTPSLLDMPAACGAPCTAIALTDLAAVADCLVCREDAAMRATLAAGLGTAPPDLPPNVVTGTGALGCQRKLLRATAKGVGDVQKIAGRCEASNILATDPVDCEAALSSEIAAIEDKVDSEIDRCSDTTGLAGCVLDGGDPGCLGDATTSAGLDLVDAVFATD
jgi:hypothetical protein